MAAKKKTTAKTKTKTTVPTKKSAAKRKAAPKSRPRSPALGKTLDQVFAATRDEVARALAVTTPQKRAFEAAWSASKKAKRREDLEPASTKRAPPFGMVSAEQVKDLGMLIGIVFTATRTLIMMCQAFAAGKTPASPLKELTKELVALGIGEKKAKDVAAAVTKAGRDAVEQGDE